MGGFSASNIWRMRAFFEAYSDIKKLAPLVREIAWSHNLTILQRCKDRLEREFYLRMTRKFGWSKNVLIHQIDNQSYEKSLLGQTNFDQALTPELRAQAKLAVKDEYTFDFLDSFLNPPGIVIVAHALDQQICFPRRHPIPGFGYSLNQIR